MFHQRGGFSECVNIISSPPLVSLLACCRGVVMTCPTQRHNKVQRMHSVGKVSADLFGFRVFASHTMHESSVHTCMTCSLLAYASYRHALCDKCQGDQRVTVCSDHGTTEVAAPSTSVVLHVSAVALIMAGTVSMHESVETPLH